MASNSYISSGIGADSINNQGDSVIIYAGADNDDIFSVGDDVTISSGAMTLLGAKNKTVSIIGGSLVGNGGGSVNNVITSYTDNARITVSGGKSSITSYGDSSTIKGGTGKDSIKNYGDGVSMDRQQRLLI